MSDNIVKDFENDFTKAYCTDDLHKKIISELTTRKEGEKTGKKINLLPETLRVLIYHVATGKKLNLSAKLAGLNEKTVYNWRSASDSFKEVLDLAEQAIEAAAVEAVYKAIVGTKPGFYQITHPVTKQPEYIPIKETPPNVQVAQWLLEKRKYFGGDEGAGQPQLGAPRNEQEAELLEMLLNKHYDYVKSKESTSSQ